MVKLKKFGNYFFDPKDIKFLEIIQNAYLSNGQMGRSLTVHIDFGRPVLIPITIEDPEVIDQILKEVTEFETP